MKPTNKRIFLYLGVAVIGVVGFIMTEPEPDAKSSLDGATKASASSTRSSSRAPKESKFTEEDENARFARLDEPINNAFKPVVVDDGKKSNRGAELPNQIPANFMNGENGWFLTGIVTADGQRMALLENATDNQGEYLTLGQTLKSATLTDISANTIVLTGPSGESKLFTLLENRPVVELNAQNAPLNPLSGQIGISQANAQNNSTESNRTTNNEASNATR